MKKIMSFMITASVFVSMLSGLTFKACAETESTATLANTNNLDWVVENNVTVSGSVKPWYDHTALYSIGLDAYDIKEAAIIQTKRYEPASSTGIWKEFYKGKSKETVETLTVNHSCEVFVLYPTNAQESCGQWILDHGYTKMEPSLKSTFSGAPEMRVYKKVFYVEDGETLDIPLGTVNSNWFNQMCAFVISWKDIYVASLANTYNIDWKVTNSTSVSDSLNPWYDSNASYTTGLDKYKFKDIALIQTKRYEPASSSGPWKDLYAGKTSETVETLTVNHTCEVYVLYPLDAIPDCGQWIFDQGYKKCAVNLASSDSGVQEMRVYKKVFRVGKGEKLDIPLGTVNSNWFNQMCAFIVRWFEPYSDNVDINSELSYSYDLNSGNIAVLANIGLTLAPDMEGTEMSVSVSDDEKILAKSSGILDKKGKVNIKLVFDYIPGEYTVLAESEMIDEARRGKLTVSDIADKFIFIDDIKEGRITKPDEVVAALNDEGKKLIADRTIYDKMSNELKLSAAQKILDNLKEFTVAEYEDVLKTAIFETSLISKNPEILRAVTEIYSDETGIKEKDFYKDFIKLSNMDEIYNYLAQNLYSSNEEFLKSFEEGTALFTLKEVTNKTQITSIIKKYKNIFGYDTENTEYKKYEGLVTEYIVNNIEKINKPKDITDIINKGITKAKGTYSSNEKGSSGGGGGGGSGTSHSVKAEVSKDISELLPNDIIYEESISFDDVSKEHWAHKAISYLAQKKVISGNENGLFKPSDNITRAEFVKIISLLFKYDIKSFEKTFEDVFKEDWYFPYVGAAYENGIIKGDGDRFNPEDTITRQDAFVILRNAVKQTKEADITFTDRDEIDDYALDAIKTLKAENIIKGFSDNTIKPKNKITRAEAAQLFYNTEESIKRGDLND